MLIFHVADGQLWREAQESGRYEPPSLAVEGFIHLSTAEQLSATLDRFFGSHEDLVLLAVETESLAAAPRWDDVDVGGGRIVTFPHLYGALPVAVVTHIHIPLHADELGGELPELFARWGVPGHNDVSP